MGNAAGPERCPAGCRCPCPAKPRALLPPGHCSVLTSAPPPCPHRRPWRRSGWARSGRGTATRRGGASPRWRPPPPWPARCCPPSSRCCRWARLGCGLRACARSVRVPPRRPAGPPPERALRPLHLVPTSLPSAGHHRPAGEAPAGPDRGQAQRAARAHGTLHPPLPGAAAAHAAGGARGCARRARRRRRPCDCARCCVAPSAPSCLPLQHTPFHPCTPAAEEMIYGPDGMSTMQQRRLVDARRVVQKLVVSGAMTENPAVGPRTVSVPRR